jgi:hypothetical protein
VLGTLIDVIRTDEAQQARRGATATGHNGQRRPDTMSNTRQQLIETLSSYLFWSGYGNEFEEYTPSRLGNGQRLEEATDDDIREAIDRLEEERYREDWSLLAEDAGWPFEHN